MKSVYSAVRTGFLNKAVCASSLNGSIKIRAVGAEMFHEEGWPDVQTDITKLTVAFRNSTKGPVPVTLPRSEFLGKR